MIKYVDTKVVFKEVPNHITLALNISNCPCHCEGCHSPYLAEDIGTPLTLHNLMKLIQKHKGISCVAFMGGDSDISGINYYAEWIKKNTELEVAWYSGKSYEDLQNNINSKVINLKNFDYIKVGSYISKFGPLDDINTNQRFFKVLHLSKHILVDHTYEFWEINLKNIYDY